MHTNERKWVTNYKYNQLLSAISMCHNQSKFHWIYVYFTNFCNIMSKYHCYTLRDILAEMFVDKNSDFDLDVADSL